MGIPDFCRLNSERLQPFSQLDVRSDKKWNLTHITFNLCLDIAYVLASNTPGFGRYTFQRNEDNSGFTTTDGNPRRPDGSNALTVVLENNDANLVPTLGFIVEF
ncbi:MAG: hypothetical protein LPK09_06625 [Hymenobacteraceae bacterium]|nr:hypothetical protein [Hymenobacteraceae bacterium]